jgi:hypothetical protein
MRAGFLLAAVVVSLWAIQTGVVVCWRSWTRHRAIRRGLSRGWVHEQLRRPEGRDEW